MIKPHTRRGLYPLRLSYCLAAPTFTGIATASAWAALTVFTAWAHSSSAAIATNNSISISFKSHFVLLLCWYLCTTLTRHYIWLDISCQEVF